jgi:purine-binding chemotaxis protein CheW
MYCTFWLGGSLYGVEVRLVRELALPPPLTPVPHAPPSVLGYVNLRGHVHLVLDLKRLLGQGATAHTPDTRLVLFKPALGDPFGALVDRAGDIVAVAPESVEAAPDGLVSGVGKLDGGLLILLDARKFLESTGAAARGP